MSSWQMQERVRWACLPITFIHVFQRTGPNAPGRSLTLTFRVVSAGSAAL
jgi:hypothetical protein